MSPVRPSKIEADLQMEYEGVKASLLPDLYIKFFRVRRLTAETERQCWRRREVD